MAENGNLSPGNKLILIVDDDDAVRDLLEFMVIKEGFRVEKVSDGGQALKKAQELMPDLILLDLMLPHYGGFEILRQLQAEGISGIPIIVVSGRYMDRSTSEMIRQESNVVDFLEKPVNPAVLAALLHKTLKTCPPRWNTPESKEG
ncbi:MAG: response regulator transcription factor [Elusimicrobia bacterium]|nr:response regulator transcription factor [Elusimicrobiota bacterium]